MSDKRIKSLELWTNPLTDFMAIGRANVTRQFSDGLDSEKNYRENIKSPISNGHITFSDSDFSYTYNSHGFRSLEFDHPDIDVLYAGCSFTEGEGLPIEFVWPSQINKMIEEQYGKNPGLYSVARGGLSPNGICRRIYGAFEILKLRPKLVLVLFPSIFRDEFHCKNFDLYYPQDYVPSFTPKFLDNQVRDFYKHYEETIRVSNSINDFFKNLIFINTLCKLYGAEFRFSSWQGMIPINELPNPSIENMPKEYLSWDRSGVLIDELIADNMPAEVRHKYFKERFIHRDEESEKKYPQTIARDFAHPGPNPQYHFASQMFSFIKPELDRIYENNQHPGPVQV